MSEKLKLGRRNLLKITAACAFGGAVSLNGVAASAQSTRTVNFNEPYNHIGVSSIKWDVPFHRYEKGKDLSEIALSSLANLDAIKITIPENITEIDAKHFMGKALNNKAVIIETNWSRHWGTDQYFDDFPYVNEEAATYLRDQGVIFVGIDSYNIDDTKGKLRPCHSILLHNDIPICEHMTGLAALPGDNFKFFAVPVKVKGMGTFPVRAFGIVSKQ